MPNKGKQSKRPVIGFVYVLTNPCLDCIVKVGSTRNNPYARCSQVSGELLLPMPFKLAACWAVSQYTLIEKIIHEDLDDVRLNGEFFHASIEDVENIIKHYCPSYKTYRQHIIDSTRPLYADARRPLVREPV